MFQKLRSRLKVLGVRSVTWSKILIHNPQVQGDTKKRKLLKNPTKIEEIQKKNVLTEIEPLQLAF